MLRLTVKHISWVVLLNILIKPVWLLVENMVHNVVGHHEWGQYTALLSFAFLFITLSDMGINQYSTKTLASQPELIKQYFPNLLSFKVLLTVIYPILMIGAGWLWGFRDEELLFLGLLSLVHGANQLLQFLRSNFQALQKFTIDGWASIADKLLLVSLVVVLLLTKVDVERFIVARILSIGLAVIVFYIIIIRLYGIWKPNWDMQIISKVLKASFSFALITVLYSIHDKVDQVMLEKLAGEVETSLYAGAYRWLDAASMYLWLTLTVIFAKFAYHIKEEDKQFKLLKLGQIITALPLMFVSIFVFFHGEVLLFLFSNSNAGQLATMELALKILFIALFINGIFMVYSTLLTSTGYEKFVNKMIFIGIGINISMNWILIPHYGAIAAAWSTVVSLGLMGIGYIWYTATHLSIKVPYELLGKILFSGLILAACFWGGEYLQIEWYWSSLLSAIIYVLVIWRIQLLPEELFRKS
ncbi:MAG: oligosaccharide flippase family protein [Bacteroidota bacterium]